MGLSLLAPTLVVLYTLMTVMVNSATGQCVATTHKVEVRVPGCANVTIPNGRICNGTCSSTSRAVLSTDQYKIAKADCCLPVPGKEVKTRIVTICQGPDGKKIAEIPGHTHARGLLV
jgi:hypothetical protein